MPKGGGTELESVARDDTGAGHFRLPVDRRSSARPVFCTAPEEAVQALLEAMVRGDLQALGVLLTSPALETLARLVALRGREALSESLKRHGRPLLDCRLERLLELPDGGVECRMRLFRLEPGGQIRNCCWVVQVRLQDGTSWRISGLDRLPGGEEDAVDSPARLPP